MLAVQITGAAVYINSQDSPGKSMGNADQEKDRLRGEVRRWPKVLRPCMDESAGVPPETHRFCLCTRFLLNVLRFAASRCAPHGWVWAICKGLTA